ncbi:MAG: type 1 glutamine amidotransferase [Burkholderiaceae bacterium]
MRPVAILQHEASQGPGYLLEVLKQQDIRFEIFHPAEGQALPRRVDDYSGLVVLGSNHSVNETLPWIEAELALLRAALAADVPVLGHCFGGQLLARALGARVHRNAWPNIGWSRLWVTPAARSLFGGASQALLFNWHYDTFEIPRGARRLLFGRHCLNKGFALGRNLGFQSHLEVTEESVRAWCRESRQELGRVSGPAVQSEAQMLAGLRERTAELHALAGGVYRQWMASLAGAPRLALHNQA